MSWQYIKREGDYHSPLSHASMDSDRHPLLDDSRKVFNIERFAKDNGYNCSTVDAVHIDFHGNTDPKTILIIEFKGGLSPTDWEDHKENTFYKKCFDTLHVLLKDIVDDTDSWCSVFSERCNLKYIICLDERNALFQEKDKPAKQRIRNRSKVVNMRNKVALDGVFSSLRSCSNRHPFSDIAVIRASDLRGYF